MALMTRFDPFREALSLRDAMDRLFQESYVSPAVVGGRGSWTPMDVHETADAYTLTVSLPGWKPEDINITVQEGTVTIAGQYTRPQESSQEEGKTYHLRERSFASFSRSFSFPMTIDADRAEARYENGELVLSLPKAESAKPRQIKVGGGTAQPKLVAQGANGGAKK